eukprot:CAMPEP_0168384408 /NCGR_PEP_ID=MMETSP0228-20121227/14395_1 /TAXON_ID=133427 /ORGANISM="Protoceratium reticulatum, Strain CCCM 535 (=CCMP 1889)" /LENGTH=295 /DNA_ID=CAMNT_0008397573 /DNA_START=99 /DNA_END=987 /DNA_ORIENTATION=-
MPKDVVHDILAAFLGIQGLGQFQLLSARTMADINEGVAWRESICRALPRFELPKALLDMPQRRKFAALLPPLLRAAVAPGIVVPLRELAEVRRLSKVLSLAQRTASAHLAKGGRLAQVFIVTCASLQTALAPWRRRAAAASAVCLGELVGLPLPEASPFGPELRLRLAWLDGQLLVAARADKGAWDNDYALRSISWANRDLLPGNAPLTLDITSASPSLALSYRGIHPSLNGTWKAAVGICESTGGKASAVSSLASGVPCVVCVRDAAAGQSTELVHVLHLEDTMRFEVAAAAVF